MLGCSSNPATPGDAGADAPAAFDAFDANLPGWKLAWSDEFDGANGAPPDPSVWTHDVGGDGWGNNELEYYTDGAANSFQRDGDLVIVAKTDGASAYSCANDGAGGACQYTSARIWSKPTALAKGFAQQYGRFAARMKVPAGKGLWPAFWMMGTDIDQVGWPKCGETDVMEILGDDTTKMYGTLHMDQTGGSGEYSSGLPYTLPSGSFSSDFHVFAVEWTPAQVDFYVDDTKYETVAKASLPQNATWELDQPFFILLNLAVGSADSWPGAPDSSTVFPAELLIDWVRVYVPG